MRDGIKAVLETNFILSEVPTLFLPHPATFQKKASYIITMMAHRKYDQCIKFVHFDDVDIRPEVIIHVQDIC